MTSVWKPEHVRNAARQAASQVPVIARVDRTGLESGRIYWDMWPVQTPTGHIAQIGSRELWMALSAPDRRDPMLRHFEAKIHWLERREYGWRDLGPVLPNFAADYEREWSGSAVFDEETLSLFFTGAGVKERHGGYQQRLFETHAKIGEGGLPENWSTPVLSVHGYGGDYMPADVHEGEAGKIKAFRDPAYFKDPADGQEYLIFSGSLAASSSDFNGVIGIARRDGQSWSLLPALISADGVNNELERAHVVFHQGRYYAFWVTQTHTFAPELRHAPTGLYGMVADSLFGEYRPLNGSGLVLANPEQDPAQCYSWFVSSEMIVSSFVDFYGLGGKKIPFEDFSKHAQFGGIPAPLLMLDVGADRCGLAHSKVA